MGTGNPSGYLNQEAKILWGPKNGLESPESEENLTDQRASSEQRDNLFDRQAINILENMTSAFFALDHNGCFIYMNNRAEQLLQCSRQSLIGQNIWQVCPSALETTLYQEFHRALQDGIDTIFEEFYAPLGRWFEVQVCCQSDHLAIYFQDITLHKRTQLELTARNRELQTLQKITEITLNTQSLQSAFQQIVKEISQATDYPIVAIELYDPDRQMMIFMGSEGVPSPADGNMLQVPVHQTLSGTVALTGQGVVKKYALDEPQTCQSNELLSRIGIKTFICMPMIVNQHVLGVLSLAHPELVDPEEPFLAWITSLAGYLAALTDRKKSEEALRTSENRLSGILEIARDAIITVNQNQKITLFNQGAEKIFGYQASEVLGQPLEILLPSRFTQVHQQHIRHFTATQSRSKNMGDRSEVYGRRKDGTEFPAEASISKLTLGDDVIFTAILRDVSERKQTETTLRLQTERERMLSAIGQRIYQSLELDEILHTTVAEVRQFLQADRVLILRFEPDWSAVVEKESVGEGWQSLRGKVMLDSYFVETKGRDYAKGKAQAIDNVYTAGLSQCYIDFLATLQLKAKLVVPILQAKKLWGLLIVHHCENFHHWQSWEVELLQNLTTQLEIAIQQANLYSQIQYLNSDLEQQIQERTTELQQALDFEALLKRITDKVRDSLDEKQILETAVEELALGLGLKCCDAGIYSAEQTLSTIAYEYTKVFEPIKGFSFLIAESPIPEVFPQLFRGQYCHFCNLQPNALRSGQNQFVALACPIIDDRTVMGDMWLFKEREDTFSDREIRLVQQVVNQCAISLRQARLYQTAQAQVRQLERLNRLKDDFLSTVSHELRTPMSSIKMATQMLEILLSKTGLLDAPDSQLAQYFQILNSECKREISLINDLLDLARLDADAEPLILSEIQLIAWLPHIAEVYIERTRQQEQVLKVDIPDDLPALITDLSSLERILSELLHNACKYTPAGEQITLSAGGIWKVENVRQSPPSNSSFVLHLSAFQISVTNSGVEIPASERTRIFDKFYRIPNNDPWKHGGTGLGLALVKKLVERLNGTIEVQSYNHQTSFTIVLPQLSLDAISPATSSS